MCGKWSMIVIQKAERVPVLSRLDVKVVDQRSKTSHQEHRKVPKLELT